MSVKQTIIGGLSAAALILAAGSVYAAGQYGPGVTDTEIKIGNTNPYSGPASSYGINGKVHAAYFAMINEQGGINGRKINYISRDDSYSPPKTVEQVRQLVEQDKVFVLFGTLGTPPNMAIHDYLNEDYGKDYLNGLRAGLGDKAAKMIVATQSYETTDPTIDSQVVALQGSGADVLLTAAIPKFAA